MDACCRALDVLSSVDKKVPNSRRRRWLRQLTETQILARVALLLGVSFTEMQRFDALGSEKLSVLVVLRVFAWLEAFDLEKKQSESVARLRLAS